MKRILATLLLFGSTLGFAEDGIVRPVVSLNDLPLETKPVFAEKVSSDKMDSFIYLKMSAAEAQVVSPLQVIPGIGIGYRLNAGHSALDLSTNYVIGKRLRSDEEGVERRVYSYFYTFPKASYLYYFTPAKENSLYAGAGLAWGGLRAKDSQEFHGIIPSASVGYELARKAAFRSFVQLDVSQPALAVSTRGAFPGPLAELSVGAGF